MRDEIELLDIKKEKIDNKFLVTLFASYVSGLSLGLGGRMMEQEWILPVIVPGIDFFGGGVGSKNRRRALCYYFAYGIGVANAHADRIFQAVEPLVEKLRF